MRTILLFLTCFFVAAAPTWAATAPRYRDKVKDPREEEALAYLASAKKLDPTLPYRVAAFDLNYDGVDEWIFEQSPDPACAENASCRFLIVGLSERKPVLLADLKAGKILISDQKLYGVRKLEVYNQKNNDFAYSLYVWTPQKRTFLPPF